MTELNASNLEIMLKNINLLKIFNYINNEYCIVYVHYMKHVTSILANTILANTTAKFAQVAAGLLSACCGMSSTGRMSHAFARHVAACRHMAATDCRQICCKLL